MNDLPKKIVAFLGQTVIMFLVLLVVGYASQWIAKLSPMEFATHTIIFLAVIALVAQLPSPKE